ncbi:MAG: OmpA family protein [Bacteroidota bacterium]
MRIFLLLVGLTVCLSIIPLQAQKIKPSDYGISSKKALNFFLEGEQFTQWRDRENAIKAYEEALALEPDFSHAHFRIGVNAYVLKEYEEALPHLEKVAELTPGLFKPLPFYLAESYFYTENYEKSLEPYSTFLDKGEGRRKDLSRASVNYLKARFASRGVQNPVDFEPINLGEDINGPGDEYLPFLTADDQFLLFTSKRPDGIGKYDPRLGDYPEDFFFSEKIDGKWTASKNLGPPINTPYNEGASSISQDGRKIFYTACNREDGFGSCDIYVSYREGNTWSEPENIGPAVNTTAWESQPCLSHDEKTLYFTSLRGGGVGGRDLWYSTYENGKWTPAVNMGTPINTPGQETSPFIHADGKTLYFSSDFHPGFGSKDLFFSRLEEGKWTKPKNLGYPLNTVADESNIFVSSNGKLALINSTREGGFGKSDLYEFEMDQKIRPQLATFVRGTISDSLTTTPVYAHISMIDLATGDTIRDIYSDKINGKFLMSLPLEKNYAAVVQAPGYLFSSKNFSLKGVEEETYYDLAIALMPIQKGAQVVLSNIFFESGSYELKKASNAELQFLVNYLKQNPGLTIEIQGHTDDVGSPSSNQSLSQKRAEVVKDYLLQSGTSTDRITAKGYGESQPVADNATEEGKAANRRTEFKIIEVK